MKFINLANLAHYHSLIKGFLTKVDFLRPTVKVRPGKPWDVVKRDVYLTYNTEDYTGEVSLEPSDDAIAVQSWSDGLRFVIKCDSKAEAEALLDNGYSFRLSFLSRKYGSPKWVCPSNLSNGDPQGNGSWIAECPQWNKIPLSSDTCVVDGQGNILVDIDDVRNLMTACDGNIMPHVIADNDDSSWDSYDNPILERAMLLGTEACPIYNKAIFYKKKLIKLKGVLPYLQDTEQEITYDNVMNAPSNAYSFKVKAAVWYNDQELPGASVGCLVVTKKKVLTSDANNFVPVIQFKYKEEINNFK